MVCVCELVLDGVSPVSIWKGKEPRPFDMVDVSDATEFGPIVAVGEFTGESSTGITGSGFSSDKDKLSEASDSDAGVEGDIEELKEYWSKRALSEATLFLRSAMVSRFSIRRVVKVSRRVYKSMSVAKDDTLFGIGRRGERGGGGGGLANNRCLQICKILHPHLLQHVDTDSYVRKRNL